MESKSHSDRIVFWDRATQSYKEEKVYGNHWLKLVYETRLGQVLADNVFSKRWLSYLVGKYESSEMSRRKISSFIEDFSIDMNEFEEKEYGSFNDFFIRKFKDDKRPFVEAQNILPAPAEARYFAYNRLDLNQKFSIKGLSLDALAILKEPQWAKEFEGGPVLIARLCPTDYHRFHFPDDGTYRANYRISGNYHSVNPVALSAKENVFGINERHVSILDTKNFGLLGYVEVGAMCVGKIIQSHPWAKAFKRGQEKGYFLFGASTVLLFGQKDAWLPDADLIERTERHHETLIRLGDGMGRRI